MSDVRLVPSDFPAKLSIYDGNHVLPSSLQSRRDFRSQAYYQSIAHRGVELKAQDFEFVSDPKQPLSPQLFTPIFSNQLGPRNGQVIGNSAYYKEIELKFFVYMNIPVDAEDLPSPPTDIPNYFVHYALVYSKTPYNGSSSTPNPLSFSDVFNDVNPTDGTVYSTPFSFKGVSRSERYVVLLERTVLFGGFNPFTPTPTPPVVTPNANSPPFSQYFHDTVRLWDPDVISGIALEDMDPDMPLFSRGLQVVFQAAEGGQTGQIFNEIETGSLWVVAAISPEIGSEIDRQPNVRFWSRVVFSDQT